MVFLIRIILWSWVFIPTSVWAESSCKASNDFGDECEISCPEGESAQCINGGESRLPECECLEKYNADKDKDKDKDKEQ